MAERAFRPPRWHGPPRRAMPPPSTPPCPRATTGVEQRARARGRSEPCGAGGGPSKRRGMGTSSPLAARAAAVVRAFPSPTNRAAPMGQEARPEVCRWARRGTAEPHGGPKHQPCTFARQAHLSNYRKSLSASSCSPHARATRRWCTRGEPWGGWRGRGEGGRGQRPHQTKETQNGLFSRSFWGAALFFLGVSPPQCVSRLPEPGEQGLGAGQSLARAFP